MEWGSLFAFVIVNALSAYSKPKGTGECIHGGILKNAYLEDFKHTNHSRIENVDSMKACVKKCCHIRDCDIAMMDSRRCYVVNCAKENACRVRHTTSSLSDEEESELSFILSKAIPDEDTTPAVSSAKLKKHGEKTSKSKKKVKKKRSKPKKTKPKIKKRKRPKPRKKLKPIGIGRLPSTKKPKDKGAQRIYPSQYIQNSEFSGDGEGSGTNDISQIDETSADENFSGVSEGSTYDQSVDTIKKVPYNIEEVQEVEYYNYYNNTYYNQTDTPSMQTLPTNNSSYYSPAAQDAYVQRNNDNTTNQSTTDQFLEGVTSTQQTNQVLATPLSPNDTTYIQPNKSFTEVPYSPVNVQAPTNQTESPSTNQQTIVPYYQSNPNVSYSQPNESVDEEGYSGEETEIETETETETETEETRYNQPAEASSYSQSYPQGTEASESKQTAYSLPYQQTNETYSLPYQQTNETYSLPYQQTNETYSLPYQQTNETYALPYQQTNETYYQTNANANGSVYSQSDQSDAAKADEPYANQNEETFVGENSQSKDNEESSTDFSDLIADESGSGLYEASGEEKAKSYQPRTQSTYSAQTLATTSSLNDTNLTNSQTKYYQPTQPSSNVVYTEPYQQSNQTGITSYSQPKEESLERVMDELNPGETVMDYSESSQQVNGTTYSNSNLSNFNTGYYQPNQTYVPQQQLYTSSSYAQPNPNTTTSSYLPQGQSNDSSDKPLTNERMSQSKTGVSEEIYGSASSGDEGSTDSPPFSFSYSNKSVADSVGYVQPKTSTAFTVTHDVQMEGEDMLPGSKSDHGGMTFTHTNGPLEVTSGSGTFANVATPEGYVTTINQEMNQEVKNMKHFDAPVNEIDVDNLGASGVPQDGAEEANTSMSQPEVNLTNIRPTEHGNMIVIDNDTVIKVEKMQDEDKITDDDETSGSATGLHQSDNGNLAHNDDSSSGDTLLRKENSENAVTDIGESGDDDTSVATNDTTNPSFDMKGEDSFENNISGNKTRDNQNTNILKGVSQTNTVFPYVNITISPQLSGRQNDGNSEPVGITISSSDNNSGMKGNETTSGESNIGSTNSKGKTSNESSIEIKINASDSEQSIAIKDVDKDEDEDSEDSSGLLDQSQAESGSGIDGGNNEYILDGLPAGVGEKHRPNPVTDPASGDDDFEGSGLTTTTNNTHVAHMDDDESNKDITGNEDVSDAPASSSPGKSPEESQDESVEENALTTTNNNTKASRLNDDGTNMETTNSEYAANTPTSSPGTMQEASGTQAPTSGNIQKEAQLATTNNSTSALALKPPVEEASVDIQDNPSPSNNETFSNTHLLEEKEDSIEYQTANNNSKLYNEGVRVIEEGKKLAAANSNIGSYAEGARVIEEGKQQAKANRTYASNLKPLNGEASIDMENNPEASDNETVSQEDNEDSTAYPIANDNTTLNNEGKNVFEEGQQVANTNDTYASALKPANGEASMDIEDNPDTSDNKTVSDEDNENIMEYPTTENKTKLYNKWAKNIDEDYGKINNTHVSAIKPLNSAASVGMENNTDVSYNEPVSEEDNGGSMASPITNNNTQTYNKEAKAIEESQQVATTNNTHASTIKPLNSEASTDMENNPDTLDNETVSQEDNEDSTVYPTTNNDTNLYNQGAKVVEEGQQVAKTDNTYSSTSKPNTGGSAGLENNPDASDNITLYREQNGNSRNDTSNNNNTLAMNGADGTEMEIGLSLGGSIAGGNEQEEDDVEREEEEEKEAAQVINTTNNTTYVPAPASASAGTSTGTVGLANSKSNAIVSTPNIYVSPATTQANNVVATHDSSVRAHDNSISTANSNIKGVSINPAVTNTNDASTTNTNPVKPAASKVSTTKEAETLFPEQWMGELTLRLGETPTNETATVNNQSSPDNGNNSYYATNKNVISEVYAASGLEDLSGEVDDDEDEEEEGSGSGLGPLVSKEASGELDVLTSTNRRKKHGELVNRYLSKNNSVNYQYSNTTATGAEAERSPTIKKLSKEMKLLLNVQNVNDIQNVHDSQNVNDNENSGSGVTSVDENTAPMYDNVAPSTPGTGYFDDSDNNDPNETEKSNTYDKEQSSGSGESISTSGMGNDLNGQDNQSPLTFPDIVNEVTENKQPQVSQEQDDANYDGNLYSGTAGEFNGESELIGDAISSSGIEEVNEAFSSSEFSSDTFADSQSGSEGTEKNNGKKGNQVQQGKATSSYYPHENITYVKSESSARADPTIQAQAKEASHHFKKDENITRNGQGITYKPNRTQNDNIDYSNPNKTYTKNKKIVIGESGLRDTIEKSGSERSKLTDSDQRITSISKKLVDNNIVNYEDSDIDVIDIVGLHPHIGNKSMEVEDAAKKRTILYPVDTIITSGKGNSHHNTLVTYDKAKREQIIEGDTALRSIIPMPIAFNMENDISAVMHSDVRNELPPANDDVSRRSTPNITWTTYNGSQIIPVPIKSAESKAASDSAKSPQSTPKYMEKTGKKENSDVEKDDVENKKVSGKQNAPNITWTTYNGSQIIPVPLKDTTDTRNTLASSLTSNQKETQDPLTNITWTTYNGSQIIPIRSGNEYVKKNEPTTKIGKAAKKEIAVKHNNITWSTYNGSQIIPVPLKSSDTNKSNSLHKQKPTEHSGPRKVPKLKKAYKKKEAKDTSGQRITWTTYNGSQIIPVPVKGDDRNKSKTENYSSSSKDSKDSASSFSSTKVSNSVKDDSAPNITWKYNGSQLIPVPIKSQKSKSKEQKETKETKVKEYSPKNDQSSSDSAKQTSSGPNITWKSYNGSQIIPVPLKSGNSKEKKAKVHSSKNSSKKPSKKDIVQKVKLKKSETIKSFVNWIPLGGKKHTKVSKRNRLKSVPSHAKSHGRNRKSRWKKKSYLKTSKRKNSRKSRKKTRRQHTSNSNDYNHPHPMGGHRYGDVDFDSIHKNANHDKSASGHYGLHDDTQDNHDEADEFSDRYPPQDGEQPQNKKSIVRHLDKAPDLMMRNRYFAKRGPEVAHTCVPGLTLRGATLRGGILSGDFKSMGVVETQKKCIHLCCKSKKCDVAMTVGRECINIRCFDKNACAIAPAGTLYDSAPPVATFVQHVPVKDDYVFSKRSTIPSLTKDVLIDEVDNVDQSIDLQEILNEVDKLGW